MDSEKSDDDCKLDTTGVSKITEICTWLDRDISGEDKDLK